VQASVHEIPCADQQFDFITCFGVLEHLPPVIRKRCIAEAARLLKPRGQMYVVINNKENPFLKHKYQLKKPAPKGYYVTLVDLDWLKKTCQHYGLSVVLRAANPCYALVHYGMMPSKYMKSISQSERKALFQLAVGLDLRQPLLDPIYKRVASHFLVEITHNRNK
jgi:ubiquinone/menaquinone biosynthesis C-methylase UbiE